MKARTRGTRPAGVTRPSASTSTISSPTPTPSAVGELLADHDAIAAGVSAPMSPLVMTEPIVDTSRSSSGSTPRTVTPAERFARDRHRLTLDVRRRRVDVVAREHALAQRLANRRAGLRNP